ncbi:MAG: hypothetical protein IJX38_06445 [Clostridia bacterium]|nr:hypothetical protein [Clostridia bacterium]
MVDNSKAAADMPVAKKKKVKAAKQKKDVVVGFDVALKALLSSAFVVVLAVAAIFLTDIFAYGVFILAVVSMAMSVYGIANAYGAVKTYMSNEKTFNPVKTLNTAIAAIILGTLGMFFEFGLMILVFLGPDTMWFSALFYVIAGAGLLIALLVSIKSLIGISDLRKSGLTATHGLKTSVVLGFVLAVLIIAFFVAMALLRSMIGYDISIIEF